MSRGGGEPLADAANDVERQMRYESELFGSGG
jgi:hypothetical protein